MEKATANQALQQNKIYKVGDIGEVRAGKSVGLSKFIEYHLTRGVKIMDTIAQAVPLQQEARQTYVNIYTLTAASSPDCAASLPMNLSPLEIDVVNRLSFKVMKK